jgi:hypothetical protein
MKFSMKKNTDLSRKTAYMDCMVKEAIEIKSQPNNFNTEDGFTLSQIWQPTIHILKHQSDNQGLTHQAVDSAH